MNAVSGSMALSSGIGLSFAPLTSVFPAVTCPAQATMRTGLPPAEHGIIANGRFDRAGGKVDFWNQSAWLFSGERIWEKARAKGRKAAVLFTQQSLGDSTDFCLSPAPIHKHHGGMVQACQTRPPELETQLLKAVGRPFKLQTYWGPMAYGNVGLWCAECTAALMRLHGPDILLTYLPNLDYCLQREGPHGPSLPEQADILAKSLKILLDAGKECGYETVVWGDYSITAVDTPVYPNKALLKSGLFTCRNIKGMLYPNIFDSRAFAMSDHQVAHVFIRDKADIPAARSVLEKLPGIDTIQTPQEAGLLTSGCGELVLTAAKGAWFAYQWWDKKSQAPDYATHVDIHSKIGFDPCELFWDFPFISTSTDCSRIKGSHGRTDADAAFAVTDGLAHLRSCNSLLNLSNAIKDSINS